MFKAIDKWLPGYLRAARCRLDSSSSIRHLVVCIADHFEPIGKTSTPQDALDLVLRWHDQYASAFEGIVDADGKPPQHTFFYPEEEYDAGCLDTLSKMCASGIGEVEVHLHHRNDTAEGLTSKLTSFRDKLNGEHGMLGRDKQGNVRYGFIHGNWALCNSRPDGDWCGVNEELGLLSETGCYADFTFPSAPSPTQPRMVNAIYRAHDTPGKPRAHDHGIPASVLSDDRKSQIKNQKSLLLIQGPLGLNWKRRKWGILPRLENAEISGANPLTGDRIDLGVRQHIHVQGRSEWVFLKYHTHGAVEENMDVFFNRNQVSGARCQDGDEGCKPTVSSMRVAHEYLRSAYNDGTDWVLHYVTAREMYNIVRAAEDGHSGNPGDYRDYEISPPAVNLSV